MIHFWIFAVIFLCGITGCGRQAETLDVISYNIRMGVADDGENSWEHRRGAVRQ